MAEAVEVEAATPPVGQSATISAWVFAPEQEPRQVSTGDLSELLERDSGFVWVDVS
ncbi:MAG: hypothetical protein JO023_09895, partial [Chloroflexi bacterium]|nr:hypothetical protein [Chloroflexota bacterium]